MEFLSKLFLGVLIFHFCSFGYCQKASPDGAKSVQADTVKIEEPHDDLTVPEPEQEIEDPEGDIDDPAKQKDPGESENLRFKWPWQQDNNGSGNAGGNAGGSGGAGGSTGGSTGGSGASVIQNATCSVLPPLPSALQESIGPILDFPIISFPEEGTIVTPFDEQMKILEAIVSVLPGVISVPMKIILPLLKEVLQIVFKLVGVIHQAVSRLLVALTEAGILPSGILDLLNSIIPGLIIKPGPTLPGLPSLPGFPSLPSLPTFPSLPGFGKSYQSKKSSKDLIKFLQILSVRIYLLKDIKILLWLGLPVPDIVKIKDTLVRYLKEKFNEDFDCPLDLSPINIPLLNGLKDVIRVPLLKLLSWKTQLIFKILDISLLDQNSILGILTSFLGSLQSGVAQIGPTLTDLLSGVLETVTAVLELVKDTTGGILDSLITFLRPCRSAGNLVKNIHQIPFGSNNVAGLGAVLDDIIDKVSSSEAATLLATTIDAIYEATQKSLNISAIQTELEKLLQLRPIGGVTRPASLVTILNQKVPEQLNRLVNLVREAANSLRAIFQQLGTYGTIKEIGQTIENEIKTLTEELSRKPAVCVDLVTPLITAMVKASNKGLSVCVQTAAGKSQLLAKALRGTIQDVLLAIKQYYEGLSTVAPDKIQDQLAIGDKIIGQLQAYISNLSKSIDVSGLHVDACAYAVQGVAKAEAQAIMAKIALC